MRTLKRWSPVFGAAALLAGCSEAPRCPGDWCGTIVVTAADPDVLFPPTTQVDVGAAITDLMFLKLADLGPALSFSGDSGFVPQLAQRWSWDNPRTVRFILNPAARWHDGRPVRADDVTFTFEIYRDTLVNAPARPLLENITSVTAEDSLTVVFRFRQRYSEQFFDAVNHMRVVPRHLLDTIPRRELAAHSYTRAPIGNGPFRFVRWVAGEYVELAADSAFFLGRPGVPRVILRVIANPGAGLTQLIAGEADFLNYLGIPENRARVVETPFLRAVAYTSNQYAYIGFNLRDPDNPSRPHPLFADRSLRQALSMGVNREAIVQAVLGDMGEVSNGPISRILWIWSDTLRALPFDTARARRLLEDVGWRDADGDGVRERGGRRLEFELLVPVTSQPRRRAAVIAQEDLKRLGVNLRVNELDLGTFLARGAARQFDAMFGAWGNDPSPRGLEQYWGTAAIGAFNYGSYSNPVFDRLVTQAINASEVEQARALWHRAIGVINADAPAIWVFTPVPTAAVHRRLQHVTIRGDQWGATLWSWSVHPDSLIARDRIRAALHP